MPSMTKWMTRSLAAIVVAGGSLVAVAGPAQAYDSGTCNGLFGAANVADVDPVLVDTGTVDMVDFGDGLHLWGAPQGTAVVCWHRDGRVAVKGRVYADNAHDIAVRAEITLYNAGIASTATKYTLTGHNGASRDVSRLTTGGNHDRVRIRLYFSAFAIDVAPGHPERLVHTSNRYRG